MTTVNKTRNTIGMVISGIVVLAMLASTGNKLIGGEGVTAFLTERGLGGKVLIIGIIELLCVIAFVIPKTNNIGFFLLTSYLGGAIVTELSAGEMPVPGVALNTLLWVGTYLRKPEIFGLD
ncbi:MAG: DoxX family protein [Bacteroidota bacterium]